MKKILFFTVAIPFFACNNSKKEPSPETAGNNKTTEQTTAPAPGAAAVVYSADGVEIKNSASVLVTRDKDKLQPGAPFLCMLTSNAAANNNEYLGITFLLDTKPGIYPVVSYSFQRGKSPNDEMYGSLLGGNSKITDFKVTVTECKDLGDNKMGGHKWSISGYWDELTIKASPIMLMDKTTNHPAEVKIGKGSFTNLSFDDNWDQMLEEGLKKMKEK